MKKIFFPAFVALIFLIWVPVTAEEVKFASTPAVEVDSGSFLKEPVKAPEEKIQIDFSDVAHAASELGQFGLGFCAGFAAHEAAHDNVANANGIGLDWNIRPNFFQSKWFGRFRNDREARNVALAGLQMQVFSSELLLAPGMKKNSFSLGWLTFNVVNALAYVGRDSASGGSGYGDIGLYRRAGGKAGLAKAIIAGHAFLTAYRVIADAKPWFDVQASPGRLVIYKNFPIHFFE